MTRPIFISVPVDRMIILLGVEFYLRYAIQSAQVHYRAVAGQIEKYLVCMFYSREDATAFILTYGGEEITYHDYD